MRFLEDGLCQVWWARPQDARPSLDLLLDQDERDRRDRLLRREDRDRRTVGIALARLVLAPHLGYCAERLQFDRTCGLCGAQHGKPRLRDEATDLQFSISHSGQRVAVAVLRRAHLGVDVEELLPGLEIDTLASEILSEEEQAAFAAPAPPNPSEVLLTYWTRKEALLKAAGDGLQVPMSTITVSGPDEPARVQRWPGLHKSLEPVALFPLHPGSGHLASLAVLGMSEVRVQELEAANLFTAAFDDGIDRWLRRR